MVLLLNREDVISVLQMDDCIDVLEKAFTELANGTADLPLRTPIKPPGGLSLYMPAFLKEMNALACKVVTVYKDNPAKHDLPTTIGTVLLQDSETGEVICIMDGGYLTAVRTGALTTDMRGLAISSASSAPRGPSPCLWTSVTLAMSPAPPSPVTDCTTSTTDARTLAAPCRPRPATCTSISVSISTRELCPGWKR